ncbi:acyltransferase [Cyanobacteria bacterium FACHB-471]|nr:acyltransferase [Cyanobacteria bacterium FACHB-471]
MRNEKIDFLRFIGLSMIILAHVKPPEILFQLRNFDVPLMVIVSGMSFGLVFREEPYLHYVWKRVKRLVFPVWIFLTLYLGACWAFDIPVANLSFIAKSYLLVGGIEYLWIIRVFLFIALIAPLIAVLNRRVHSNKKYLAILGVFLLIYEVAKYSILPYADEGIGKGVYLLVSYVCPYLFLFALGLRIPNLKAKTNHQLIVISLAIFISLSAFLAFHAGEFVDTQKYKYPPSIYYLSYAVFVTVLLWHVSEPLWDFVKENTGVRNLVLFVAQNSIWLYLWHIPLIEAVQKNFATKYLLIYAISILITYIQTSLVIFVLLPRVSSNSIKKNLKLLLTG